MNKFVLANILKNFRWLKFDFNRNLNKLNHLSKVFIVRFHVIQFTRYSVVHRRSFCVRSELLYVSTSYSVCQELFSNFLKNFFKLWLRSRPSRSSHNFFILAEVLSFVKNFFQVFSNFFRFCFVSPPFPDSLHILPLVSSFVNTFLRQKLNFFLRHFCAI